MSAVIDRVRPGDVERLAQTIRESDRAELVAEHWDTRIGIYNSLEKSTHSWVARCGDDLLGIGGLVPEDALSGTAVVWLLSSDAVERHRLCFYRLTKNAILLFNKEYPVLYNWVDSRYTRALNWLRRLGFRYEAPGLVGGVTFFKMVRREV